MAVLLVDEVREHAEFEVADEFSDGVGLASAGRALDQADAGVEVAVETDAFLLAVVEV